MESKVREILDDFSDKGVSGWNGDYIESRDQATTQIMTLIEEAEKEASKWKTSEYEKLIKRRTARERNKAIDEVSETVKGFEKITTSNDSLWLIERIAESIQQLKEGE